MTPETALAILKSEGDAARAHQIATRLKTPREVLGLRPSQMNDLASEWRHSLPLEDRYEMAETLWQSDILEARVMAAKLLVQARIRPDDQGAWDLVGRFLPEVDEWTIADALADAGARRLVAQPDRLEEMEEWVESDHLWTRHACLAMTLPWARLNNLKPADRDARGRILAWAAALVEDRDWYVQKILAQWIRDLSKHDAEAARAWIIANGEGMRGFALKEAAARLDW